MSHVPGPPLVVVEKFYWRPMAFKCFKKRQLEIAMQPLQKFLLYIGNRNNRLDQTDLDLIPLPDDLETKEIMASFDKYWQEELKQYTLKF